MKSIMQVFLYQKKQEQDLFLLYFSNRFLEKRTRYSDQFDYE